MASKSIKTFLKNIRKVTVMGLGRFGGGAGAARFFASRGKETTVTDLAGPGKLGESIQGLSDLPITFKLGRHNLEDFTGADLVLASQAARPDSEFLAAARAAGVPILTETGLALALNRSPWLGVTGSSGKSTTAAMLAEMLRQHDPSTLFGGNIGGDLLTRVEDHPRRSPLVVELSSFQLIHIGHQLESGQIAPPVAAVITNLSPNHLDWHGDLDEYYESKRNLLRHQTPDCWAVLNTDDPLLAEWAESCPARVVACSWDDRGAKDSCHVESSVIVLRLDGEEAFSIPMSFLKLRGRHNVMNAMQAASAAFVFSRDAKSTTAGAASFAGLPHRLESVATVAGRVFVNDSKGTTPEAAVLALDSFDVPPILIAGGYDKQSPFDELGAAIQQKAKALVLVGVAAGRIREAVLAAAGDRPRELGELTLIECGDDFDRAVREAFKQSFSGDVILLSPACASWGMFNDYEERGQRFRELAEKLGW